MSRIAGIVRGADRKSIKVMRQILDENASRQARPHLSRKSRIPLSGLRTVDLGEISVQDGITAFNHGLGAIPTRIEITPMDGGQVYIARSSTQKVIYLKGNTRSTVRVRLYL